MWHWSSFSRGIPLGKQSAYLGSAWNHRRRRSFRAAGLLGACSACDTDQLSWWYRMKKRWGLRLKYGADRPSAGNEQHVFLLLIRSLSNSLAVLRCGLGQEQVDRRPHR